MYDVSTLRGEQRNLAHACENLRLKMSLKIEENVDTPTTQSDAKLDVSRALNPYFLRHHCHISVVLTLLVICLSTTTYLRNVVTLSSPPRQSAIRGSTPRACQRGRSLPGLTIIGDSTMKRTALALSSILNNCTVIKRGKRCDFPFYYGAPYDRGALNSSIPSHMGPTVHGKTNRGCQDCSGCEPVAWNCSLFEKSVRLEYLGVEFAADVMYPTNGLELTQESVILMYLKSRTLPCDQVYFNTGLHDTATTGALPLVFESQLRYYTQLLLSVFKAAEICWITSTYPKGVLQPAEWVNVTSPLAISKLNEASRRVMSDEGVKVLDIGQFSTLNTFQKLYRDGVHVGGATELWYMSSAFLLIATYVQRISSL